MHLSRALYHVGIAGWAEEADSSTVTCAAARASEALAFCSRRVECAHRRSRLEFAIKTGDAERAGWCGAPGPAQRARCQHAQRPHLPPPPATAGCWTARAPRR